MSQDFRILFDCLLLMIPYRNGEAVDRTLLKSLLRMLADLQVLYMHLIIRNYGGFKKPM